MRPIWSGYITFGLVNIPVSLYSAENKVDLNFHLLDSRDQARIRYQRINERTGKEVPWNKIVRAFEYTKDQYVIIKDQDFKKISVSANIIDIENFVNQQDIDYEYFAKPYYLLPEKGGIKSYVLLRESLLKEKKSAIAKIALHEREHLAAIIPKKDMLILDLLRFKKELRTIKDLKLSEKSLKEIKVNANELAIARQLINSMSATWNPEKYHDRYKEDLLAWIEKKTKGKVPRKAKVIKFKPPKETKELIRLMKKSIASLHEKPSTGKVVHLKSKAKRRG